ncbi:MAG TPA: FMN-binding glutamate synthase family protein [Vicinamibacterales bacterium]
MLIWIGAVFAVLLVGVVVFDLTQRQHAILRTFPIVGHFRYWLEAVGPELRQYIVTDNNEERPFSRDQRRWIYASAKRQNNYFGFGSDNEMELQPNYLIIKHDTFPLATYHPGDPEFDPEFRIPCAKVMGASRGRARAFRPTSIINVSGMSFGSLSGPAVEALNRGSRLAGCLQSTGEGGVSSHHLHGGDLVWQIGTGYFGCREPDGRFSMARLKDTIARAPQIRAVEIKLSQGAKPGVGGLLPQAKITREIADIRGVPMDRDCVSPPAHQAFRNADEMLDFVEWIASETGLPVGIKSAVGDSRFWEDLARSMAPGTRGVDFITIDGGEGGTGAGPLVFTDHVALPFKVGFSRVQKIFTAHGLHERVVFIGSGKLGFPEATVFAFALGCDAVNVGREAMMAVGCIQAQRCHTNHCPTGVATQHPWLVRGVDPTLKAARLANYIVTLRKDVLTLSRACGAPHPALITADQLELLDGRFGATTVADLFGYGRGFGLPSATDCDEVRRLMSV